MNIINNLPFVLGLIGVILFVLSIQFKKRKDILFLQEIAEICYFFQYTLIGAYSAAFMDLISASRCYVFIHHLKRRKYIPLKYLLVFVIIIIIMAILTYDGFMSLLPVIITIGYFIGSYVRNIVFFRVVYIICGFLWIIYNLYVGVYICIIGNIGEIISGIISLLRIRKYKLTKIKN